MMTPYPCLIVGLGQIGMGYDLEQDGSTYILTHARAISLHPSFKLVGAVDPVEELRGKFEKYYKCPAYKSIDKAMLDLEPQIIIVAVPTNMHLSVIENVLSFKSTKVILCEKPLSHDLNDANKIVYACQDKSVKLFVNYIRRSDPGVKKIKNRFDRDEIISPVEGVVWYSKGFLHNGSHFFNLLEYWLGQYEGATLINHNDSIERKDVDVNAKVYFSKGNINFIPLTEKNISYYSVEIYSSSGRLYWGQSDEILWQSAETKPSYNRHLNELSNMIEIIPTEMNKYQWNVFNELALALTDRTNVLCDGEVALETLESMYQVFKRK